MRRMKDSGIEYIGLIPDDWDIHPLYCYFGERKNKNYALQERNLLSLSYGKIIRKDIDTAGGLLPASFNTYNVVEAGDIIIRPTDLQNDKRSLRTGLVKEKGIITSAYIDLKPYAEINSAYYHYLLHTFDVMKVFYNMGNGVRQGLNYSEFSKLLLISPNMKEQESIVSYLNARCKEINELYSDVQSEIDTLERYKQALIIEVVTKGINKNVPMKDSKIDWVGTIPFNWDVHPLYCYFRERKNKNYALQERNLLSLSYGKIIRKDIDTVGGLLPASFNTYNVVEAGDIIIRPTDLQNDKRSLRTGLVKEKGIITSAYIDLAPNKNVNSAYFHYLLHSYDIMKVFYNMGNGVRQGLNYGEFSKLMVLSPSRQEQNDIVEYLDGKCEEIEKAIEQKKSQLSNLEEYERACIFEFVTGKKEVPKE